MDQDKKVGTASPGESEPSAPAGLLPCPFCGGEATNESVSDVFGGPGWYIQCLDQKCRGNCNQIFETKQVAAKTWNRRAPESPALPTPKEEGPDPIIAELVGALERIQELAIGIKNISEGGPFIDANKIHNECAAALSRAKVGG